LEPAIKELKILKANLVANLSEEEEKGDDWDNCVDLLEELEEFSTIRTWDFTPNSCMGSVMVKVLRDLERLELQDGSILSDLSAIISVHTGRLL
jgi:hypothetical protein